MDVEVLAEAYSYSPKGGNGPLPKVARLSREIDSDAGSSHLDDHTMAVDDNEEENDTFNLQTLNPTGQAGIWTQSAFGPIQDYRRYAQILELAHQHPENLAGHDPVIHPSPGTILVFEKNAILSKYPLLKTIDDARRNVKSDGYSYGVPDGVRKIGDYAKRSSATALDGEKNTTGFKRIEAWNDDYILLHYFGNDTFVSKNGVLHGNAKLKKNRFVRTQKAYLEQQKSDLKPFNAKSEDYYNRKKAVPFDGPPKLAVVQQPRDLRQVQNCKTAAIANRRLGPNTVDNITMLHYYLNYPNVGCDKSFIYKTNVVGNITVELHAHDAIAALDAVLQVDGNKRPQKLYYDTTFLFGDTYLSLLSWYNPAVNRIMILGAFLHNRKFQIDHKRFFTNFYEEHQKVLKKGRFLLFTDSEFELDFVWENLRQLLCSIHMLRNLKANISAESKEAAVNMFLQLKRCHTFEAFDKLKQEFLDSVCFLHEKDKKLFDFYTSKLRDYGSVPAWARHNVELLDGVDENEYVAAPSSNVAESINAMLRRLFGGETPLDLLIVKIHHLSASLYTDFVHARYSRGSWQLNDQYSSLKKGEMFDIPREEILELPNPEDYASSIKDCKKVVQNGPSIDVAVTDGEENYARKFIAAKLINSCSVTNLGAGKYWVEDSKGAHAVKKINDNQLDCQCNVTKTCVHMGAVMMYLNNEVKFDGPQDPVKTNNEYMPKYTTKSGRKPPRNIDADDLNISEHEFDEQASLDKSLEEYYKYGKTVAVKTESEIKQHQWQNNGAEILENEVVSLQQLRTTFCEKMTKAAAKKSVPPTLNGLPEWFLQALERNPNIPVKSIMRNTFDQCVPVLNKGECCFLVTSDDVLLFIQREGDSLVKAIILHNMTEEAFQKCGNAFEECSWAASFCARNTKKVHVEIIYQFAMDDRMWAAALFSEIQRTIQQWGTIEMSEKQPERLEEIVQTIKVQTKTKPKRRTFDMYCCCSRPHLKSRSDDRTNKLNHSELISCSNCGSWQYSSCNGIQGTVKGEWLCSNCNMLPILPPWGPSNEYTNTCSVDNFIATFWCFKNMLKSFIGTDDSVLSEFDQGVLSLINSRVNGQEDMVKAKVSFLNRVFKDSYKDNDLYGGEDAIERLNLGGQILVQCECFNCNRVITQSSAYKLSISKFDSAKKDVKDFISNRLHTYSIDVRERCCQKLMVTGNVQFGTRNPWMLLLSALHPKELQSFTMEEILRLPLTVNQKELHAVYMLAAITFHLGDSEGHFVSVIRCQNNWLLYDGLNGSSNSYFGTLPSILQSLAEQKALMGHIIYFRSSTLNNDLSLNDLSF